MSKPKQSKDRYRGRLGTTAESHGKTFYVTVHWGTVEGQVVCVGLDLRSFRSKNSEACDLFDAKPITGGWTEITSPVVRGFRTAEIIEFARVATRDLAAWAAPDRPEIARSYAAEARNRRGPTPQLDDDAIERIVAPAYRGGGRKPVQAVRQALEASGLLRSPVTIDQARKAVMRARKQGALPPAPKKGTPS